MHALQIALLPAATGSMINTPFQAELTIDTDFQDILLNAVLFLWTTKARNGPMVFQGIFPLV